MQRTDEMINALTIARKLTDAGFTRQQAEAQAELWHEIVESELATKRDIKELEAKNTTTEANLKRDISELEANLKRDIKELETSLTRELRQIDTGFRLYALQVVFGTGAFVIAAVGLMIRFLGR